MSVSLEQIEKELAKRSQIAPVSSSIPSMVDIDTEIARRRATRPKPLNIGPSSAFPREPEGNWQDAIEEPVFAIGSNLAGSVAAGGAGIGDLVAGKGTGQAAQDIGDIRNTVSQETAPKTQAGRDQLGNMSSYATSLSDFGTEIMAGLSGLSHLMLSLDPKEAETIMNNVREKGYFQSLGDATLETTGSPELATIAKHAPEIAGAGFIGGRMIDKNLNAPRRSKALDIHGGKTETKLAPYNVETSREVARIEGKTPGEVARLGYDPLKGDTLKLTKDPTIKPLVKYGFTPGTLQGAKSTTKGIDPDPVVGETNPNLKRLPPGSAGSSKAKTNQSNLLKMIGIKRRAIQDPTWGATHFPTDVLGQKLLDIINHSKRTNQKAGKLVNKYSKKLRGKIVAPERMSEIGDDYINTLEGFGVAVRNEDGTLMGSFDYSNSVFYDMPDKQDTIERLTNRMFKAGANNDGWDLHIMKGWLDEVMIDDFGKSPDGMKGKIERVAKKLRDDINQSLRKISKPYADANITYSETIDIIKEFESLAGKNTDLSGELAHQSLGRISRKILTNYAVSERVIQAITDGIELANKHGGSFENDMVQLIRFAHELDTKLGAQKAGSMLGIMQDTAGKGGKAKEFVNETINRALTPDEEKILNLLEKMVRDSKN